VELSTAAACQPAGRTRFCSLARVAITAWLLVPGAAPAVVVETGDGSGNTSAPADDPGWLYVGKLGGLSAVYLGDGWVLTARHAAAATKVLRPKRSKTLGLAGAPHPLDPVPAIDIRNPDGSLADLVMLRLQSAPDLPDLEMAEQTPRLGTPVVMIGRGKDRVAALAYWRAAFSPGTAASHRYAGFDWTERNRKRWGTNRVERVGGDLPERSGVRTRVFATSFDRGGSEFEAQAARGDSGGAVFTRNAEGVWVLAGIMLSVSEFSGQGQRAIFGNLTLSAEVAFYRDQIRAVLDRGPTARR